MITDIFTCLCGCELQPRAEMYRGMCPGCNGIWIWVNFQWLPEYQE